MFASNTKMSYNLTGLRNLNFNCNYALNNNSITYCNDWVAVAIQYLAIGKTTGITFENVVNRLITKKVFSQLWCSAVKTFFTVIAVSECFKSFNFNTQMCNN